MHPLGFIRITATTITGRVADPDANAEAILGGAAAHADSDILLFPELCVSGYTCGDLFRQHRLLEACRKALRRLIEASADALQLWVVGMPLAVEGRLYNVAAVIHHGALLGIVPKQYLPNYLEFYEQRWFRSGAGVSGVRLEFDELGEVPFGTDLLFECGTAVVGIEICEDLWMPHPPSSSQAMAGANILLNLSASNETIGKAGYRESLVLSQSGRCLAAYAYASAGPSESTTDLVFGGHCLIAENGSKLGESSRVGQPAGFREQDTPAGYVTADIDLERLLHDRRTTGTFHDGVSDLPSAGYRRRPFALLQQPYHRLRRFVSGRPFVPEGSQQLDDRCREIFGIQCAALAKRVAQLPADLPLVIGVSGGLDSTLALLVAVAMCDQQGWSRRRIHGLTMPGFGTSAGTLANARRLMELLGIVGAEADIREACLQLFRDLQHCPFGLSVAGKSIEEFQGEIEALPIQRQTDLVFENVQARVRTLMLMSRGFVLGTGDLSEQALGWSTYNGDHMSMYNVNCSIPKTLVQFLVRYVASHRYTEELRRILLAIADTPISPELLPLSVAGSIQQATESSIGPYELHDFFLYHFLRTGASPEKILYLASQASFAKAYEPEMVKQTLQTFFRRFFANQFKRSCVPDGPKVGSVSLSPRGDWRMPSDASVAAWLDG
jgi:NAD+ synthase (glutamine-hydrolysing)